MPLGDHLNRPVNHFDSCLIVNRVACHRHVGRPLFGVGHGILRQIHVIQVRKHSKVNNPQCTIAPVRRSPADELLPNVGGHHHAARAQSHVDRGQRRQEIGQPGLPHPIGQVQGVATIHQEHVSLLHSGQPTLLIETGQRGKLQHAH